ncbi:hypothetical protein PFISCL1PPCAC_22488, partial [Pristionchus fissidentatus]
RGFRFPKHVPVPARPKTRLDLVGEFFLAWGGVGYVLFIVGLVTYIARFVACPAVFEEGYCSDLNLLAIFLVSQVILPSNENKVEHWQRHSVVASLCRSMYGGEEEKGGGGEGEGRGGEDDDEEEEEEDGGKFCVECNRYSPIRSHHCPLCKYCVLRKDHHCYITGGCVGLGNQRYFIVFLFWATVGTAIGARFIFLYMDAVVAPWYPFGWVQYIAPVAVGRWLLGYDPIWVAFTCMAFSFAVASCIGALAFFVTQMFYTLHGYTMFEYHSLSIRDAYDGDGKSVGERMRLVFGPFWPLSFIFPAFMLKQKLTPEIADNLFRVRSKLL